MGPVTVLSSDAHVFEPPDLWTTRIDAAFRDRAPRMVRVDGADEIVVAQGQGLSGIGLLSNTGVRFEAPERSPAERAARTSLGVARPRPAPARHAARRGGRRRALPFAGLVLLPGCRPGAHVGDLSRRQPSSPLLKHYPLRHVAPGDGTRVLVHPREKQAEIPPIVVDGVGRIVTPMLIGTEVGNGVGGHKLLSSEGVALRNGGHGLVVLLPSLNFSRFVGV
jgi:hypothetical protein